MKRLLFGFSVLLMSVGCSGAGDDNNLKICTLYADGGYTYEVTINDILNKGAEVTNKNGYKIVTHHDVRNTKIVDVILLKIDVKGKPSCYSTQDIYVYSNNQYIKDLRSFVRTLSNLYGNSEIAFKTDEIK